MTVDWSKASRSNQSRPLPPLAADDDSYLTPAVDAASVSTAFRKMGTGKPPQTNFAFMLNKSKSNSSPPAAASSANEKAGFSYFYFFNFKKTNGVFSMLNSNIKKF